MFQTGRQIGIYTLIEKIGKGGVGEVWLAERRGLVTTKVAVKLPREENVSVESIKHEAELWARVSGHPNVLPIIEADIYDGQIVIVSEYARDGSLRRMLRQNPLVPLDQATELLIGILRGLAHLHSNQIIHRDIKPENILLQGNTPRLTDFGISRMISSTLSQDTSITGTPNYMAPEAFDGKRDICTDIWSVGVVAYEMVAGRQPFPQREMTEVMGAIVLKDYPPLPDFVPAELRKIITQSLEKPPAKRQSNAREMLEQIKDFAKKHNLLGDAEPAQPSEKRYPAADSPYKTVVIEPSAEISETVKVSAESNVSRHPDKAASSFGIWRIVLPVLLILAGGIAFFVWSNMKSDRTEIGAGKSVTDAAPRFETPTPENSPVKSSMMTLDDWINKGNEQHSRREYEAAIESYTQAVKINPNYSPVYNNRGVAYGDKGDLKKAMADFRKALELDPANNTAKINLDNLRKARR